MAGYATAAPFAAKDGFRGASVGEVKKGHMPGQKTTGTLHTHTKARVGKDAEGGEHKRMGRKGRSGYGR